MPETIGQQLRAARDARGLTIEDIAHKTRIHRDVVRQLEEDDHAAFPNLMFVKSFLKIYSEYADVDASETITRLGAADSHHGDQYLLGGINPAVRERFGHLTSRISMRPILATAAAAAMLVVGGSYLVNHLYGDSSGAPGGTDREEPSPAAEIVAQPNPEEPAEPPVVKVSDPDRPLVPKTLPHAPADPPKTTPAEETVIPKASPVVKKALPVAGQDEAGAEEDEEPEHATNPSGEYEPFVVTPGVVSLEE